MIDKAVFHSIQQKMSAKSPRVFHPRHVPSPYVLSGLIFCSCGRALTGHSGKSGRHFYYFCQRSSKQGKEACNSRPLQKDRLERVVLEQIKSRILTEENLEKLVKIVNEELQAASCGLKDKFDAIETEAKDVQARLSRLYEVLESGKLTLDDLAPRIRELRLRQDELNKARVQAQADMVVQGVQQVDKEAVKAYA